MISLIHVFLSISRKPRFRRIRACGSRAWEGRWGRARGNVGEAVCRRTYTRFPLLEVLRMIPGGGDNKPLSARRGKAAMSALPRCCQRECVRAMTSGPPCRALPAVLSRVPRASDRADEYCSCGVALHVIVSAVCHRREEQLAARVFPYIAVVVRSHGTHRLLRHSVVDEQLCAVVCHSHFHLRAIGERLCPAMVVHGYETYSGFVHNTTNLSRLYIGG